ncbi:hypothetical protein A0J48_009765 [Sphaerospermopsis aphanizomenoides BCCUSP55]|uniref:hypothetical protein n=1 Tax=Sphaerospermopsis aphanizomenoides TaxID=459663 RepID=UPI001903174F|nr:hypothetical protein [Sphaerospermopsis aphanizomenoides]MBK1987821.1 hypothetical protein [Sphaerospermopsis aphanizomenoides BCCUSP55]
MLEKILLASILTFSVSLLTDMGSSNPRKELVETPSYNHEVFTLTHNYKNPEIDINR